MARVDVVIPAFNAAATIGQTLASLGAQTFGDFRVLVIDDGSTDGTADLARARGEADRRVEVVRRANGGITDARNAGLRLAAAEFIAVQDADDLSDPDRLRIQVEHLDAHPGCVAVSGAARHIDAAGRPTGGSSRPPPPEEADPSWFPAKEPYLMPFGLLRRSALLALGGYRHADYAEDTDLYWRLGRLGTLTNLPGILGSYRYHSCSASGGGSLVNTRVLAVNGQLAALSAARVAAGEEELPFEQGMLARYRAVGSLDGIIGVAREGLRPDEARRLATAAGAKFLQWVEGRGVEPAAEDCASLRRMHDERPPMPRENEAQLRRLYAVAGARLLRRGRLADARTLVPPPFRAEAVARALLRRA